MLDALMDGDGHPAGELANRAGVAASTASGHLSRLLAGGLVSCSLSGRERRYRLASPAVAEALESLARVAPPGRVRSLRAANRAEAMREARTCYDHLAGRLGVRLTETLVRQRVLVVRGEGYALTRAGEERLERLGIDVALARRRRRAFALACLDWSERRPHLAGSLGAALSSALLDQGWLAKRENDRGLTVTGKGRASLVELGVDFV
jgi:DNA-binding transcriptional ArsR family regulator